jgi:hypothetical protein
MYLYWTHTEEYINLTKLHIMLLPTFNKHSLTKWFPYCILFEDKRYFITDLLIH